MKLRNAFLNALTVIFVLGAIGWIGLYVKALITGHPASKFNPLVATALATLAAVLIAIRGRMEDSSYQRSQFYLEKSISGFAKAKSLLESGPAERASWIGAARVLEKSRRLSQKVTVPAHQDVLEVEMDFQRRQFSKFFQYPAQTYYGISDTSIDLDEAACRSTERSGTTISTLKQIPEKAIYTVYTFMKYPENYDDPLEGQFTEYEIMFLSYDGLKEYLQHRREYDSAAGRLYKREESDI